MRTRKYWSSLSAIPPGWRALPRSAWQTSSAEEYRSRSLHDLRAHCTWTRARTHTCCSRFRKSELARDGLGAVGNSLTLTNNTLPRLLAAICPRPGTHMLAPWPRPQPEDQAGNLPTRVSSDCVHRHYVGSQPGSHTHGEVFWLFRQCSRPTTAGPTAGLPCAPLAAENPRRPISTPDAHGHRHKLHAWFTYLQRHACLVQWFCLRITRRRYHHCSTTVAFIESALRYLPWWVTLKQSKSFECRTLSQNDANQAIALRSLVAHRTGSHVPVYR